MPDSRKYWTAQADSGCFVPPTYGIEPGRLLTYFGALGETFYG